MEAKARLSSDDREFFCRIEQVAYMNPFNPQRARILTELVVANPDPTDEALAGSILPEMNARLARLEQRGLGTPARFVSADQAPVRSLFLYRIYHRYLADLNQLIEEQSRGNEALIPFAKKMLADFAALGLTESEALHYLAIFYQLRRAYYFIVKSLVGRSPSMQQLCRSLWNAVFTNDMRAFERHLWGRMEDFSTLLLGETGTGKGSAAAAIGRSGYIPFDLAKGRFVVNFTDSFIATNLSQFPESLIESELFGHRKGAFTGAIEDHKGWFELCSRYGALFLDEIGEVSVPAQIKLLQVLQERTFRPVGSHQHKRFAGRVIAATNKSIDKLRASGRFRDDFFYRLCSHMITLPTLRQRLEEDPNELERLVREQVVRLTGEANADFIALILETFKRDLPPHYPWPGNVRELEQAVRCVLLTHHYTGDMKIARSDPDGGLAREIDAGALNARQLLARYCVLLYDRLGTMEEVARRTGLDRRTVKKYLVTGGQATN